MELICKERVTTTAKYYTTSLSWWLSPCSAFERKRKMLKLWIKMDGN